MDNRENFPNNCTAKNKTQNWHCDILTIYAGTTVLAIVSIPTLLILVKDMGVFLTFLRTTRRYWIWDTISLHCRTGINYYLFVLICGYCSVYLTTIKTLEFNTHINEDLNQWILWINLFSYQFLLGVGIFETHPHPSKLSQRIKASLHIVSAGIFFSLNISLNMFWAIKCVQNVHAYMAYKQIQFHVILTIFALILFIFVVITSSINTWFLSRPISTLDRWHSLEGFRGYLSGLLVVPTSTLEDHRWCVLLSENEPLLYNQANGGCNCLQRRQIYRLCALNYLLEIGLIVCTVSATLLHSFTKNKLTVFLYIKDFEKYRHEYGDICLVPQNNTCKLDY